MSAFDPNILQSGDALLYSPHTLFGYVTALKTWHGVSHVEIYDCGLWVVGSHEGKGVNRFEFRRENLVKVLRPPSFYNHSLAMEWFKRVKGQKYDYKGLLCFALAVRRGDPDRMFCSEYATRHYRHGGFEPFQPTEDADHIAPFEFETSQPMTLVWSAKP
jgi:hypothetical protein